MMVVGSNFSGILKIGLVSARQSAAHDAINLGVKRFAAVKFNVVLDLINDLRR